MHDDCRQGQERDEIVIVICFYPVTSTNLLTFLTSQRAFFPPFEWMPFRPLQQMWFIARGLFRLGCSPLSLMAVCSVLIQVIASFQMWSSKLNALSQSSPYWTDTSYSNNPFLCIPSAASPELMCRWRIAYWLKNVTQPEDNVSLTETTHKNRIMVPCW
jgi:hypothetical protein